MNQAIVAVNKDPDGNIIGVKTDTGAIFSLEQAVQEVEAGRLSGVQAIYRKGKPYLRSFPDGSENNNLDNLPEF